MPLQPRPSRARLTLLELLCALTFVLYIDRVCIVQAVEPIQQELKLSNTQISYVVMTFTLAYGLFEMPAGRWEYPRGSVANARSCRCGNWLAKGTHSRRSDHGQE